ncbi:hypothetical protein HY407_00850 [Candidatus Gottesmanbacteria bacterium]|nr:hypothetical protein [Candidatus Gottesmanbacteria bacterium]
MDSQNNKQASIHLLLFVLIIGLTFIIGLMLGQKSEYLPFAYKSKANINTPPTPPVPSSDALPSSIMNTLNGKITAITDEENGKKLLEVSGLSMRDLFETVKGANPRVAVGQLPKPPAEKKYTAVVTSSTSIVQLPSQSPPFSLKDFMGKVPPSPLPPKTLTIKDLTVGMSVTIYLENDGLTAVKIEALPQVPPLNPTEAQELLTNPPSLPPNAPTFPDITSP